MRFRQLLFVFLITGIFASCVPPHALYIRNYLTDPVDVTLHFSNRENLLRWQQYHTGLPVRTDVTNFSKTGSRRFKEKLSVTETDSLTIRYRIPARSVVAAGSAWGFDFSTMQLNGKSINKTIRVSDIPETRTLIRDNQTGKEQSLKLGYAFL